MTKIKIVITLVVGFALVIPLDVMAGCVERCSGGHTSASNCTSINGCGNGCKKEVPPDGVSLGGSCASGQSEEKCTQSNGAVTITVQIFEGSCGGTTCGQCNIPAGSSGYSAQRNYNSICTDGVCNG